MTSRRALTLVEVLASLAILSAIATACLALVQTSSRSAATAANRIAWNRAADAVMASIAADLSTGDFDPIGDRARGDRRARIGGLDSLQALAIRTRAQGGAPCVRLYSLSGDRLLIRTELASARSSSASIGGPEATALAGVAAFVPRLDTSERTLQVTIDGPSGLRRSVFVLEAGAHQ